MDVSKIATFTFSDDLKKLITDCKENESKFADKLLWLFSLQEELKADALHAKVESVEDIESEKNLFEFQMILDETVDFIRTKMEEKKKLKIKKEKERQIAQELAKLEVGLKVNKSKRKKSKRKAESKILPQFLHSPSHSPSLIEVPSSKSSPTNEEELIIHAKMRQDRENEH